VKLQVKFMDENPKVGIGKGRYGIYETKSLSAFLENVAAVIEFLDSTRILSNYKPLGTGGSIYRVNAIREIGGFNVNIKGVGEDMDLEFRIKNAGWMLAVTSALFYETRRQTWKDIWDEYFWHGAGGKHVLDYMKKSPSILLKIFPFSAIFVLVKHSISAYKIVYKKGVFLLPFHWLFKRIAWLAGFTFSYLKASKRS
jgi:cellulose synthase/poly-beta-1,6-N-acetylglucosamine synthase-like glycosyltransferase